MMASLIESTYNLGKRYEQKAEDFLISLGYRLVRKNYRHGRYEIDLIMLSPEQILVFVEVKFRSQTSDQFHPWESISPKKKHNLFQAAAGFINDHPDFSSYYSRYDTVIITLSPDKPMIEHFPDAFREGGGNQ